MRGPSVVGSRETREGCSCWLWKLRQMGTYGVQMTVPSLVSSGETRVTFETEANGESWSTYERGPSLAGSRETREGHGPADYSSR
jgi:hypothetical protein